MDIKSNASGVENKGLLLWHFPSATTHWLKEFGHAWLKWGNMLQVGTTVLVIQECPSSIRLEWNSYWVAQIIIFIIHPQEKVFETSYRTAILRWKHTLVTLEHLGDDVDFFPSGNNKRPHYNSHRACHSEVVELKLDAITLASYCFLHNIILQLLIYQISKLGLINITQLKYNIPQYNHFTICTSICTCFAVLCAMDSKAQWENVVQYECVQRTWWGTL